MNVNYYGKFRPNYRENPNETSPPFPPLNVKKEGNVRTYISVYSIPFLPERMTPTPSQFPKHNLFLQPKKYN